METPETVRVILVAPDPGGGWTVTADGVVVSRHGTQTGASLRGVEEAQTGARPAELRLYPAEGGSFRVRWFLAEEP